MPLQHELYLAIPSRLSYSSSFLSLSFRYLSRAKIRPSSKSDTNLASTTQQQFSLHTSLLPNPAIIKPSTMDSSSSSTRANAQPTGAAKFTVFPKLPTKSKT